MSKRNFFSLCILFFTSVLSQNSFAINEWSGSLGTEWQSFFKDGFSDKQSNNYLSVIFKPEYSYEWGGGQHQLQFTGFARASNNNENQTHADIRELYWSYASDDWELRAGIRKVFWGVTESQHLIDIINQTDAVEGYRGEEKLGQPMINFAYIQDWGTLDFFALTGFRERNFPSEDARLRPVFLPDTDNATYDSSQKKKHVDVAVRYSHYIGDWDFGISHFYGTSREPRFVLKGNEIVPHYDLINQTGLDVQATLENWLWKLEAIRRSGMLSTYIATTFGLEYSFFDIKSSGVDLGIVTEFLYDDRGDQASTPFENDTFVGFRLAINDTQSTEALLGVIVDNGGDGGLLSLEGSRRLGESFKIDLEAAWFFKSKDDRFLKSFRNDDFARLAMTYFY